MKRLALAGGVGLAALMALAPGAWANTITVNSNADTAVNTGTCTLREAIVAANTNTASGTSPGPTSECVAGAAGQDEIVFPSDWVGMVGPHTITTTGLPDVTQDLTITGDGPSCVNSINKPCVGISVSPVATNEALKVTGGSSTDLTVTGVSITGASTGIDAQDGILTVNHLWVGLTLNQEFVAGNGVGIRLGDDAIVGSQIAGERNLFAGNTIGVYVLGGDNNSIRGSDFGIKPDGTTAVAYRNGTNIGIANDETVPDAATNNSVGNEESGDPALCEGGCNLISNATGDGLDLSGVAPGEDPTTGPTTVEGNFVGLSPNGASAQPNAGDGIDVGTADDVDIGGPGPNNRNFIGGNGANGVNHEAGGTGFSFVNNFVGLNASGTAAIPDTLRGLDSDGVQAGIAANRFGGSQVRVGGNSSLLAGNVIGIGTGGEDVGVADDSLLIDGDFTQVGGAAPTEANTIGNTSGASNSAIAVEGTLDTFYGNLIGTDADGQAHPNEGPGITVGADGPTSQVIVGDIVPGTAGNVVSNSGADAIRVPNSTSTNIRIRGNTGRNNGSTANDLMIDLGPDGPGSGTTNGGILPPVVTSASTTQIMGTSPEAAGTEIDVYQTFTDRGDARDLIGQTTVDGVGNWSFTYPAALANGACVTATQTELAGPKGVSEAAATTTIGGGACDVAAPTTTIDDGPDGPTSDSTPTFEFSSEAGASFECSIDSTTVFSDCSSGSFNSGALGEGPHIFRVRATDAVGNVGPVASRSFSVDTVAPTTTIDSGPSGLTTDSTPTFAFSANEGATFECSIDSTTNFSGCASGFTATVTDGAHTFRVRATDPAGNLGPTVSRAFTVDTAAPQTNITRFVKRPSRRLAKLFFRSSEDGSRFHCKLNAKPFLPCTSPKVYRKLKRGRKHRIQVRATDAAGNADPTPTSNRIRVPRKRRRG